MNRALIPVVLCLCLVLGACGEREDRNDDEHALHAALKGKAGARPAFRSALFKDQLFLIRKVS